MTAAWPVLFLLVLSLAAPAQGASPRVYQLMLTASPAGGPVRGIDPADPSTRYLLVVTDPKLSAAQQTQLLWHYRNAARLATVYGSQKGLTVHRTGFPERLELFESPDGVAEVTGKPRYESGGQAVARIELGMGIIYVGSSNPLYLYAELGKWFFYAPGYRWSQDARQDAEHQRLIKDFANFCMDRKNWAEAGGSTEGLW